MAGCASPPPISMDCSFSGCSTDFPSFFPRFFELGLENSTIKMYLQKRKYTVYIYSNDLLIFDSKDNHHNENNGTNKTKHNAQDHSWWDNNTLISLNKKLKYVENIIFKFHLPTGTSDSSEWSSRPWSIQTNTH